MGRGASCLGSLKALLAKEVGRGREPRRNEKRREAFGTVSAAVDWAVGCLPGRAGEPADDPDSVEPSPWRREMAEVAASSRDESEVALARRLERVKRVKSVEERGLWRWTTGGGALSSPAA